MPNIKLQNHWPHGFPVLHLHFFGTRKIPHWPACQQQWSHFHQARCEVHPACTRPGGVSGQFMGSWPKLLWMEEINNVFLGKIEEPVWYTIYHQLPVGIRGQQPPMKKKDVNGRNPSLHHRKDGWNPKNHGMNHQLVSRISSIHTVDLQSWTFLGISWEFFVGFPDPKQLEDQLWVIGYWTYLVAHPTDRRWDTTLDISLG